MPTSTLFLSLPAFTLTITVTPKHLLVHDTNPRQSHHYILVKLKNAFSYSLCRAGRVSLNQPFTSVRLSRHETLPAPLKKAMRAQQTTQLYQRIVSANFKYSVTALKPVDTPENPYYYTFRVKCTSCHEEHPNWVSFNRFVRATDRHARQRVFIHCFMLTNMSIQEQHEIPGSRGEANFVWKCRLCQVSLIDLSVSLDPDCITLVHNYLTSSLGLIFIFALESLQPWIIQKTHSASVTAGPNTYEIQLDKSKAQKIITLDCRGLEFTEFKPDVSSLHT